MLVNYMHAWVLLVLVEISGDSFGLNFNVQALRCWLEFKMSGSIFSQGLHLWV
jgi:hypothetical protein